MGICRGFPDLALFMPSEDSCGLLIELKAKGGKPRPEQRTLHAQLEEQGYKAVVVDTFAGFQELINNHFKVVS